ncbi:MAG: PLDc N-terminal domain-containing protein, partial [Lachnospiraceae bacterium]|nr:PLDc N-terminal domain-containing protein [Lachnospiraceae bacterium]
MKEKMRAEDKANVKNSIGRIAFAGISILLQIFWLVFIAVRLNRYSSVITLISSIFAFILVMRIYGQHVNAAFKMPWIMLLLLFPVLGICFYALCGHREAMKGTVRRYAEIDEELFFLLTQEEETMKQLEATDFSVANQCRYILNYGKFPLYQNTEVTFYADAAEGFEAQLQAAASAQKFIFLEYHAIEEASAFGRLKEILAKKVKEGVEVRLLYDDIGSIGFIDVDFIKRMEAIGVKCIDFNPVIPILNLFMNNRDHIKIMV